MQGHGWHKSTCNALLDRQTDCDTDCVRPSGSTFRFDKTRRRDSLLSTIIADRACRPSGPMRLLLMIAARILRLYEPAAQTRFRGTRPQTERVLCRATKNSPLHISDKKQS